MDKATKQRKDVRSSDKAHTIRVDTLRRNKKTRIPHSYTFIIKLKWGEFLSLSNRRSRNRLKPVDIYSTHSPYSLAVDGM